MNRLNIVQVLRNLKQPLKDVVVYGKVMHQIRKPSAFMNTVKIPEDYICVKFDVWAVDTTYIKGALQKLGITKGTMCFVNASISMFVHKDTKLNDWYSACGTLNLSSRTSAPILSMVDFKRESDGSWIVVPTTLNGFNVTVFQTGEFKEYLDKCIKTDIVQIPEDLLYFERGLEEESISFNKVTNIEPVFDVINKKVEHKVEITLEDMLNSYDRLVEVRKVLLETLKQIYFTNKGRITTMCDTVFNALTGGKRGFAYNGEYIIREYLLRLGLDPQKEVIGVSLIQYLMLNIKELKDFMYEGKDVIFGEVLSELKKPFGDAEYFCFNIYCIILGISQATTDSIFTECITNGISPISLCLKEPFILASMNVDVTIDELLLFIQAVRLPKDSEVYRDLLIVMEYMNRLNSTCYYEEELKNNNEIGLQVTVKKCTMIEEFGHMFNSAVVDSLKVYFNSYVGNCLSNLRWVSDRNGAYTKVSLPKESISEAITKGIKMGMLVGTKGIVSTPNYLRKELYIYNSLNEIQTMFEAYTDMEEIIDTYINDYEKLRGITLEEEQRKAVHLIKHNVFCITGISGGGKTTALDCIHYVMSRIEKDNDDFDVLYTAPTGRASKRIAEVLGVKANTIHSTFFNENFILDADFYAFDESSMINLDMLYEICKRLSHAPCKICFLGDIEQLKPIGKGMPFRDLLNIFPSVTLTVPKRSGKFSSIATNGERILNHSDKDNWENLIEDERFSMIDCSTNNIPTVVKDIVNYYANGVVTDNINGKVLNKEGITLDDIQIISPLTKSNYIWSTTNLNNVVHDIFNPNKKGAFVVRHSANDMGERYRIGDRVVNTKNDRSMQWYKEYKNGELVKDGNNTGIVNGDIGYIEDVISVRGLTIVDERGNESTGNRDSDFIAKNRGFFCVVAFNKIDTDEKYYVLYPMEEHYELSSRDNRVFHRGKTDCFSLFYAGTTHKLQGSESKVVIAVIDKLPFESNFISRNMVYTEITRAKEYVYVIGDVKTTASALATARRTVTTKELTWGSALCK